MGMETTGFRWWKLLACSIVGAVVWSLYIAYLTQFPPSQEVLGDATYHSAWRMIVGGGAGMGAMAYVTAFWTRRLISRPTNK
jgi:hypothetical protein